MRVLFDGYWWHDGPMANRSVQREIVRAWTREFPQDHLALAVRRDAGVADVPFGTNVHRVALWPHAVSNRLELARLARRVQADATVTHNYAPVGSRRSAVFIHDVMFIEHPEWFSRAERLYFSPMLRWSRSAQVVATSSATEARRIGRLAHRSRPVLATGLAVPDGLTRAEQRRPPATEGIESFALTVGRLNIRKNLEAVLAAAAHSSRVTPSTPLLVVGTTDHSGIGAEISGRAADAVADQRIRLLGRVDDDQLAWLYAHAALAITLSRDEGFGMPVVEAARFGAPVLASDIPVFRETVGEYATFAALDESPTTTAARIDEAWGVAPSVEATEAVTSRYTWERVAHTLRAALTGSPA